MGDKAPCEEWIEVDPNTLDLSLDDDYSDGVHISVFVSPYDVPEAVRGCFDEDLNRFVIQFRYLDSEPWKRHAENEFVSLRIGKHSQRLHAIEVDLERAEAAYVRLAVTAIDHQAIKAANQASKNYRIVKELIGRLTAQIFPETAAGAPA